MFRDKVPSTGQTPAARTANEPAQAPRRYRAPELRQVGTLKDMQGAGHGHDDHDHHHHHHDD